MMQRKIHVVSPVFAMFLPITTSCRHTQNDDQAALKIIAGQEALPDSEVSRSTVAVVYNKQKYESENKTCSGTLVDKRVVLTAAHCFDYGKDCEVIFGLKVKGPAIITIKGTCISHEEYHSKGYDIAMVILEKDAPAGYQPVPYLTQDDKLSIDQEIILAGYGRTVGRTMSPADEDRGTLRFTTQTIASFDEQQRTFAYTNQKSNHGQCSGDSGGPAYVRSANGKLVLAGIINSGDMYCRERGTQADVRKYSDWLKKNREKSAARKVL